MSQKWNLQDIRPPEPRRPRKSRPADTLIARNNTSLPRSERPVSQKDVISTVVIENGEKKSGKLFVLSIVIFLVIIGVSVGLSALMGKTELTLYPKHREPTVNAKFIAYPDKRADSLSYEIMTLEATGERQVKATGQVEVKEQAKGFIEILKTTPGAERLIKNTRFRTKEGLVFRIQESVVVPGSVEDESGATVPGMVRAEVFADDVGDQYNIKKDTTFDVPGFKESGLNELYKSITARNTEDFFGGFNGPKFEIDENDLATSTQSLQMELRNTLLSRIDNEKPADYLAYRDAVAITYNELPAVRYEGDFVIIKQQAILQIPLFNAIELGSYLAQETVSVYDGVPVRIDDPSVLSFKYSSSSMSNSVIANEPSLSFTLVGKPHLIWTYDADKIRKDLATLPKTAINNAVSSYPGLEGAKVHITPFWKRTFPENYEDIIIIEELKEE